ncbi:hypothetical protein [Hymenobacter negativus]|uniref:DUF1788 domain-containing protein n=1 Tax=Hymenobacter negativus TaxID=2795026 RepID=A0ABS3QGN5_9BACT|nr:hypothetical protein [Hymenobacter negativus]MBO2009954.1 hypothetical protein [Hymenobacter negativus]
MKNDLQLEKKNYKEYLQGWVNEVISDKLWEKYADLHIDTIDVQFKQPEYWIEASLFILNYLLEIIDESKYEVLLAIPLAYTEAPTDFQSLSRNLIKKSLGDTPPSFYLFPLQFSPITATIDSAFHLTEFSVEIKRDTYFKEEYTDNEYFGTVFIK